MLDIFANFRNPFRRSSVPPDVEPPSPIDELPEGVAVMFLIGALLLVRM